MAGPDTNEDQGTSWANPRTQKLYTVTVNKKQEQLYLVGRIYFPTNVDQLDKNDIPCVDSLIEDYRVMLIGGKKLRFVFMGFADHRGSTVHNEALSKRRAEAVYARFSKHPQFAKSSNWEPAFEPRGEMDSPQPEEYFKGMKVRRGREINRLNLLRDWRRVDIFANVPIAKPPLADDLIVTVVDETTGNAVADAKVEVVKAAGGSAASERADGKGQCCFALATGDYFVNAVKVTRDEPGTVGPRVRHITLGSTKASVTEGKMTSVTVKALPLMQAAVKWHEKVKVQDMFMGGLGEPRTHQLTTRDITVQTYDFVRRDYEETLVRGPQTNIDTKSSFTGYSYEQSCTANYGPKKKLTAWDVTKKVGEGSWAFLKALGGESEQEISTFMDRGGTCPTYEQLYPRFRK